jgi:death on curing protein
VIYLTDEEILTIAAEVAGEVLIRDHGLIASAVARPQASAFGEDAYLDLETKAAALLHSLARNHPFIDGNKRVAWTATAVFLWINGVALTLSNDEAYDLVIAVATGELSEVADIANVLRAGSEQR